MKRNSSVGLEVAAVVDMQVEDEEEEEGAVAEAVTVVLVVVVVVVVVSVVVVDPEEMAGLIEAVRDSSTRESFSLTS
jgi:predicted metalloprotease